jgi:hypothetical protein
MLERRDLLVLRRNRLRLRTRQCGELRGAQFTSFLEVR